jgi:glutamyl-tRNA reductase
MPAQQHTDISTFFIAGINYKKSDAIIRGQYAINPDQYTALLAEAPQYGIKELFILSTCNRTEIYGFAQSAQELCELLCSQTQGSLENFTTLAYIKNGRKAIEHLFDVAAGLDFVGPYLERIVNGVLQSSKIIKNTTGLSGGTVSVSFAAIQYIKENVPQLDGKKILLLGTGKIGRNTCKNLVDYLGVKNITLINRTENKAAELAAELGLHFAPIEDLAKQIKEAAIILVATNSAQPVILESHVINGTDKLIIDLSIPYNVEAAAHLLPNVTLINVDELSKIKDLTLQKREAEIPKAKAIIAEHINEFLNWHQMRKNVPVLKAMKIKLEQMHSCNLFNNTLYADITSPRNVGAEEKIQKVINGMAVKMRNQNQRGCHYIEAINEYIA